LLSPVKFSVDGKEYALVFRVSAMKKYQREHDGETVLAAIASAENDAGDLVRTSGLFRAALDPALQEDSADALMDSLGLFEAYRLIAEAAKDAFKGMADPNPKAPPTS
jgi:predicted proteasome-type protease